MVGRGRIYFQASIECPALDVGVVVKYWIVFIGALVLSGCAASTPASSDWWVNPVVVERDVSKTLQLYPSGTNYSILIVPNKEMVVAEHTRIYGVPTKAPAFYSSRENLVVVPRECELRVLKHEVGHALVEAYFKAPVPRWLHEELAQRAEIP